MKKTIRLISLVIFSSMVTAQTNAGFNHIAQYVVNLKISTNFYRDIMGLDTLPEPFHDGKHTWLRIADKISLHLIEGATAGAPKEKHNHICFSVTSVAAFTKKLTAENVSYENWAGEKNAVTTRADGVQQIYFMDPDGYWIEVNDAKE